MTSSNRFLALYSRQVKVFFSHLRSNTLIIFFIDFFFSAQNSGCTLFAHTESFDSIAEFHSKDDFHDDDPSSRSCTMEHFPNFLDFPIDFFKLTSFCQEMHVPFIDFLLVNFV